MDLLENPFHVLKATPRDNRQRLMELSEERSLLPGSGDCSQARADLANPRKRLSYEIAWLPGVGPKRQTELTSLLDGSPSELIGIYRLTPTARANLLSSGLSRLSTLDPSTIAEWMLKIAESFESIDPEELRTTINEDRLVSGFPEVTNLLAVESELQERRRYYRQVMHSALNKLEPRDLVKAVTGTVEPATGRGAKHGPILIDDIVDSYEVESQAFLEKETGTIEVLVEKLRKSAAAGLADPALDRIVGQLIVVVKNWDFVAQPIQVSAKSRGLDHAASKTVAALVRSVAVDLFNTHKKLHLSQTLTNLLGEVFAEVGDVAERTAEDVAALEKIEEARTQVAEEPNDPAEDWQRDMTYEASVGVLFQTRLRFSPAGIEWEGRSWPFEEITYVRWGGTSHSFNGIPTGTSYKVTFGNRGASATISLWDKDIYGNVIDRLWKGVGLRLLGQFLTGLRDGREFRFGSAKIRDYGIELGRPKWFGTDERVFCTWAEIVFWSDSGNFVIRKDGDQFLWERLSYQRQNNIHVLEAAIRMCRERGGATLSSLLGRGEPKA